VVQIPKRVVAHGSRFDSGEIGTLRTVIHIFLFQQVSTRKLSLNAVNDFFNLNLWSSRMQTHRQTQRRPVSH